MTLTNGMIHLYAIALKWRWKWEQSNPEVGMGPTLDMLLANLEDETGISTGDDKHHVLRVARLSLNLTNPETRP